MKSLTKTLSLLSVLSLIVFISCQKDVQTKQQQSEEIATASNSSGHGHLQQTKTFSSDVVVSWINLQLQMNKAPLPAGTAGQANDRCMAYSGIALYESVVKGMPAYQSLSGQLTDFPTMPSTEPGKAYHWAEAANAALADITRYLFSATSAANKQKITDPENQLKSVYATEVDGSVIKRSEDFGKEVAGKVAEWA